MIRCRDLTKRYGSLTAVDNLTFEVGPGHAVLVQAAAGGVATVFL